MDLLVLQIWFCIMRSLRPVRGSSAEVYRSVELRIPPVGCLFGQSDLSANSVLAQARAAHGHAEVCWIASIIVRLQTVSSID